MALAFIFRASDTRASPKFDLCANTVPDVISRDYENTVLEREQPDRGASVSKNGVLEIHSLRQASAQAIPPLS